MPESFVPYLAVVASHRGGSMKSTLAALLAMHLAGEGRRVALVDAAKAGGAAALGDPDYAEPPRTVALRGATSRIRTHSVLPFAAVHAPGAVGDPALVRDLAAAAMPGGAETVIVDMPQCSAEELKGITVNADAVLVAAPADALGVRSLLPFLRDLQELRSLPGRRFRTVLVPTGTGVATLDGVAVDRFFQSHLSSLMAGASLPWDGGLQRKIAAAELERTPSALVRSNLGLLAAALAKG